MSEARFAFGRNWRRFLQLVDPARIDAAEASLRDMLGVDDLRGKRFLDAGCGSGLFSLAAHRLGAEVRSFDLDPDSVACTQELRARFGGDTPWTVESGSVLDRDYLAGLGTFDVVYSWGVLHHTGRMWDAFDAVKPLVADGGALFIAIYNDQKVLSRAWTAVKRTYVAGPVGRAAVLAAFSPLVAAKVAANRLRGRDQGRGMNTVIDWIDWLGGYPFEVATPDAVIAHFARDGFVLTRLRTVGPGHGCNEFVLRASSPRRSG